MKLLPCKCACSAGGSTALVASKRHRRFRSCPSTWAARLMLARPVARQLLQQASNRQACRSMYRLGDIRPQRRSPRQLALRIQSLELPRAQCRPCWRLALCSEQQSCSKLQTMARQSAFHSDQRRPALQVQPQWPESLVHSWLLAEPQRLQSLEHSPHRIDPRSGSQARWSESRPAHLPGTNSGWPNSCRSDRLRPRRLLRRCRPKPTWSLAYIPLDRMDQRLAQR